MGIKVTDNISPILEKAASIIFECVKEGLAMLGEECVNNIRERPASSSWIDQTGNLRSSIGYAVFEYGRKEIESAFKQVKNGQEGTDAGRKMIDELAREYSDTFALVVIAGMDYAEYVERRDNKDVLASEELRAKSVIKQVMESALRRANKRINKLLK